MDEKTVDLIKERDKLQSQLSEKDDQLAAMRYRLKRMESERDEFFAWLKGIFLCTSLGINCSIFHHYYNAMCSRFTLLFNNLQCTDINDN